MLGKDYFTNLDKKLTAYAKLNNSRKASLQYHFILGSCTLMTAIIIVLSLIVLYSDKNYFCLIFKGDSKLFSSGTIPFSIALVVLVPFLLLLFFLIYKICEFHNISNKLNNENIDIVAGIEEACYTLRHELVYCTNKIENIDEVLKTFRSKYSNFVKQCSDEFAKLEEQCKAVLAAVNSTTHGVTASISKVKGVVEDVKLQINGLSAGCQKFAESCSALLATVEDTVRSEGIRIGEKIQFLQILQTNLASSVDLDIIKTKAMDFINRVRSVLIEKPSLIKPTMLRELWCLQENVNVIMTKMQKTDICSGECIQLMQNLEQGISKFLLSNLRKLDGYNGSDKSLLDKILLVELPMLQISTLRFLTEKRSVFIVNTSNSIAAFLENNVSSDLQRPSDSPNATVLSLDPALLLQDTNVSEQGLNDIKP